jgi:hypothetical protein
MCKAPKPPEPKEPKKPEFLRNRYLDAFVGGAQSIASLRTGRASLRNPLAGAATKASPTLSPPSSSGTGQPPISIDFGVGPRRSREPRREIR